VSRAQCASVSFRSHCLLRVLAALVMAVFFAPERQAERRAARVMADSSFSNPWLPPSSRKGVANTGKKGIEEQAISDHFLSLCESDLKCNE